MDNKFDDIEDFIIDDSEEVPVYEEPVENTIEPEVPTYEFPTESNVEPTTEESKEEQINPVQPLEETFEPVEPEVPTYEEPTESNVEPTIEQPKEEQVEPVQPLEETLEPVEPEVPTYEEPVVKPVEPLPDYEEPNEHPDGKIVLNKEKEEEPKLEDVGDIKLSDNKSLMFVILIGIIIFIAIMAIPSLFF
jgi:hypothetical protein